MRHNRSRHTSAVLILSFALASCTTDVPTAMTPAPSNALTVAMDRDDHEQSLTVATYNMYFGASLQPVIREIDPRQTPVRVWEAWQRVQHSNPPARIRAIAAAIAADRPALVGLQEVAIWRTQFPGDNYPGGANTGATTVVYDFLTLLLDELHARGAKYEAVASVTALDIEAVAFPPPSEPFALIDVRFTDRNIVLAKKGVKVRRAQSGLFAAYLPLTVGGSPLPLRRGYAVVDAKLSGHWVRFADTHLEEETAPFAQEPQGDELRGILDTASVPVIVVGDLNSAADGHNTRTFASFIGDRYVDAWRSSRPGFTCCQAELLDNPFSVAGERIDYVLTRGAIRASDARLMGTRPSGGLWPSDHFGVIAQLRFP